MQLVNTTDEWITERTGIKERHIAKDGQAASDLAYEAALRALREAGLSPNDIDLILVATVTADMTFPSTACIVQSMLGARRRCWTRSLRFSGLSPTWTWTSWRRTRPSGVSPRRAIGQLDRYMDEHRPDMVLVQGDTTTVFCAALAAFDHKVSVGHVEPGLRTGNIYAPWPEEINRVITSRLATIHFAPTETSRGNLLREGVPGDRITVTGNTVIDALLYARGVLRSNPPEIPSLPPGVIRGWGTRPLVPITGHRRENFGEGFESICRAIAELARTFPETVFVYPVHLNPNVREPVNRLLSGRDNIFLIEPLAYLPFVGMMDRSTLILTDSGGVQEEAPSLGKPVLVMRDTTERPEGVDAGTARLVGTDFLMTGPLRQSGPPAGSGRGSTAGGGSIRSSGGLE